MTRDWLMESWSWCGITFLSSTFSMWDNLPSIRDNLSRFDLLDTGPSPTLEARLYTNRYYPQGSASQVYLQLWPVPPLLSNDNSRKKLPGLQRPDFRSSPQESRPKWEVLDSYGPIRWSRKWSDVRWSNNYAKPKTEAWGLWVGRTRSRMYPHSIC